MKTKEQRYSELYNSGLVDSIKNLFANRSDISEEYYVLMADYIDSMNEIKDKMLINPTEIARKMPELVKSIQETNLQGIYGRTDDNRIQMNQSLDYDTKKLYFFHELTHALETFHENGIEKCGFYNGHNGMFLTEAATQYIAETLYHVSNGTSLEYREQPGTVRGANNRIPYSPLSEYQYNGTILDLLAKSMDLPLPQVLTLSYKKNGRETLKNIYESMDGNQGKFDELMNNLEQIYLIDKLLIYGYGEQLRSQTPSNITMQDGTIFRGNLNIYRELMNKTERELVATYMYNHDTEYIVHHYNEIAQFLTTPEIKNEFLSAIQQLSQDLPHSNIVDFNEYRRTQSNEMQVEMPEGYSINESGEIIRPAKQENSEQGQNPEPEQHQSENKLTLKQKVAQFLQKNNLFMNMSFVDKFVHQQLDVLPSASPKSRTTNTKPVNRTREDFMNELSNFGKYRNLPPIQRMSDPERIARMRQKMEENQQSHDEKD